MFHVLDDHDRARYVRSLASVLEPGGTLHLLCFSEHSDVGPRQVTQAEVFTAFEDGWEVEEIGPARIEIRQEWALEPAHAWLARILRTD